MPQLLYLVAERADGQRSYEQIAAELSEAVKRGISAENVQFLAEEKLRPLGVLAQADGSSPQPPKADPFLALKFRAALVPEGVVRSLTTIFKPLFFPPVIVAVLGALLALDVWLFGVHGVAQSTREILYQPAWLLAVLGLVVLSAAFHETGHATACAYGGAKPGVMGAGLYLVWPAFYTDVTDAYRLGKGGRLRTDLGGIYFNAVFILATAAAYFVTGAEPLLLLILFQHLEIAHQLLPFIRLDGYYIVSDMTGVPDMFARIKPTLKSLLPWNETEEAVEQLKPWVRGVVSVYVIGLVPILGGMLLFMLMSAPRVFATTYDSAFVQWDKVSDAGSPLSAVAGVVQLVALLLPVTGMTLAFGTLGRRVGTGAWRRTEGRPLGRTGVVLAGGAIIGLMAFIWWPNGDYKPIQPGERGTVQGGLAQVADISTGRPSLTPKREQELGGAPTERSKRDGDQPRESDETPATETTTTTTPTDTTSTTTTPTTTEPSATTPTTTTSTQTTSTETTSTTTTPTTTTTTTTTP